MMQDLEGRILAWNPAAERMYGWSEAEALTMNIRDLIPEGQREEALAVMQPTGPGRGSRAPYRTPTGRQGRPDRGGVAHRHGIGQRRRQMCTPLHGWRENH